MQQGTKFGRGAQLRRDVAMVWKELRGHRPRPFSERRGATKARPVALTTRTLRLVEVRRETADAVTLLLAATDGAPLTWLPGQFFTLLVRLADGTLQKRAYSACTPPGGGLLPLTVKRVAGGRVSTFVHERLRTGDTVEVLGPSGAFVVPTPRPRALVLVGGGSGITPLAAILHAALADEGGPHVTLVYGNRRREDVIFAATLDALATQHPARFTLQHVLGKGFDARTLLTPADASVAYFVCGPRPMMDAVRAVLLERGVAAEHIHEEHFVAPGATSEPSAASAASAATTAQPLLVRFPRGQGSRSILAAPGQTLLEAGLAAGLPLPYSCTMGGCGACKVTLAMGSAAAPDDGCLTADERARGLVLACCARPTSPCTIEVPA
jgi:ring-1,2-phenylacetyl-CoA epoxidase subunit PaaE